jgi:mRNA interferase RelE/StbE
MYRLQFSNQADKFLRKLPSHLSQRIKTKLLELASNPYSDTLDIVKLRNRNGYRLRVGDWRIIYEIQQEVLVIIVLKIAPRGGVYQ